MLWRYGTGRRGRECHGAPEARVVESVRKQPMALRASTASPDRELPDSKSIGQNPTHDRGAPAMIIRRGDLVSDASQRPTVSLVLGTYNRLPFLEQAIESIRQNGASTSFEIIIVDGGSTDGTVDWLVQQKDVVTIIQHNRGEFRGQPIRRRSWGYF